MPKAKLASAIRRTKPTILPNRRSKAITLECVKWRRGPRTSHKPSSGSCQMVSRCSVSLH
jgi:hypothetical protein